MALLLEVNTPLPKYITLSVGSQIDASQMSIFINNATKDTKININFFIFNPPSYPGRICKTFYIQKFF
ncbi:MAG: hypothetical protein KAI29_16770, partial [Cyclobacteriaceae bacterium]|nr:hypothetical protein [Cyclobacteriaceae bacterium]